MECLKDISIEIQTIGHTKIDTWECIKFNVKINGQNFDYHCGMACVKTALDYNKGYDFYWMRKAKEAGYTVKLDNQFMVKPPKIEEVLHCLFSDSQAHNECFQDWCDNYGYSSDSIKAKSTYEACVENHFKLKKALGSKYSEIESEIQKLEL